MRQKYDIVIIDLCPTIGSEQSGKRPCVILQNNVANQSQLQTVCIAPLTSNIKTTPTGVIITPSATNNLDNASRLEISQLRTIDTSRLITKIGMVDTIYHRDINDKIELFFDTRDDYL